MNLTKVLALMTVLAVATLEIAAAKISPILIFPGIMGSRLMVQDTREGICKTKPNKWEVLWVGNERLLSKNSDMKKKKEAKWQCALDELMLNSDFEQKYANIKVSPSESLKGVMTLTISKLTWFTDKLDYFRKMVEYFTGDESGNYRQEKNIKAVPYDFRLSADKLDKTGYFKEVKERIEKMFRENGNTKVTLVAHSMGGLMSHYFLTKYDQVNQAWKDKHIHAYITLSAAWSGGVEAVASAIINIWPEAISIPNCQVVPVTRSFESVPFLFPRLSVFTTDPVVIKTKTKEYKVSDYEQLFKDLGIEKMFATYERVSKLNDLSKAPGVPTYCYYGTNLETPVRYEFDRDFSSDEPPFNWVPDITYGKGDGSVNEVSAEVCKNWDKVMYQEFKDLEHTDIVKSSDIFKKIKKIATIEKPKEKPKEKAKEKAKEKEIVIPENRIPMNQLFQRLLYQYIH